MKNLKFVICLMSFSLALASCGPNHPGAELMDEPFTESNLPLADQAPSLPGAAVQAPSDEEGVEQASTLVSSQSRDAILEKYKYLDPQHLVPTNLLEKAVIYFEQNSAKIKNKRYLSVIDFSKASSKRRFFMVDMVSGAVWATTTAHGKGSDADHDSYAESFSNVSGSNASSLGYYLTAETYSGSHGLSLRLDGLSSTNSNARARAVVIHGASYVVDQPVKQGRSWGCPAVSMNDRDKIIGMLKGGSLIYAGRSGQR